ncbi:hypothetical protein [Bacillus sp. JCM 19034]|uniref:hypothetical protein n=1 Tax=Bacillus sp. JCM 19034 TaxID=1481928 RepID=UPI000A934381
MNVQHNQLQQLDEQYHELFKWLAGQYDSKTGGFYYAKSSREDDRFTPDIESTAQAMNILIRNEALDNSPKQIKEKLIRFFQNKQVKETGYF